MITSVPPVWMEANPQYIPWLEGKLKCTINRIKNRSKTLDAVLCAYALLKHRAIVNVIDNDSNALYMVDFETKETIYLFDYDFRFATDITNRLDWEDGKENAGFIRLHNHDHSINIVLDGNLYNAPNLTGTGSFDTNFSYPSEILGGELLYFDYNGIHYLVNEDYKLIDRLPEPLYIDPFHNTYIDGQTYQFYLKDHNKLRTSLYDVNDKKMLFEDIAYIGINGTSFIRANGDIYRYNIDEGRFYLLTRHDEFVEGLSWNGIIVLNTYYYDKCLSNAENVIVLYTDVNNKTYIVRGGKVINRECPFDSVTAIDSNGDKVLKCILNDNITDIYCADGKFKFNVINIAKDEKLWFEK